MPFDSPARLSVRPAPARRAPDECSRILLAAAETIEREGYEHGWQVSHAIRMAAEKVMGLGPVYASLWFERALGRLRRQDPKRRLGKKRTTADWVSRLREAAELEPLENPRWPPQYGW